MSRQQKKENAEFTLTREFDASVDVVFNAFSNAEALNEWWGPVSSKNTVIKLNFKEGGIFHYKMDYLGQASYGRFLFIKIEKPTFLEFSNAFCDIEAKVVQPPFDISLPLEILYQLRFAEKNGKTILTMTGTPVRATATEVEGFRSINGSMHDGFGATFERLAFYLNNLNTK